MEVGRIAWVVPWIFMTLSCGSVQERYSEDQESVVRKSWAIAIHGGAGNFNANDFTKEKVESYEAELITALEHGRTVLSEGGQAIDVVESVIRILEDSPYFNAGRGAVFTSEGGIELDASIMSGLDLDCGAVTGMSNIRNPISAARAVMEESPHVFLSGKGATSFALENGLEWADSSYFKTERRWNRYLELKGEQMALFEARPEKEKFGTVGCVVLDMNGNLAAGTSTGGMMMKRHGRIGDSPVIAAGTYADNNTCAISCTGHGEFFIRQAVAHDISARMAYGDQSMEEAAQQVINELLVEMNAEGGLIGVDHTGQISMVMNTTGMFRACADSEGREEVMLFE